jgi:serine/threonine protein kinase
MEYLPFGSLKDQDSIIKQERAMLLLQELQALEYFHSQNIAHRDIKPGNILIQRRGEHFCIKLTDFGATKKNLLLKSFCGTALYLTSEIWEILLGSRDYTHAVDI